MSMSEQDEREFHIICQTHWDREWRLSFQQTRVMLVDLMDHLLDMLEANPQYRHYHLDGQTILLEDYLEIRPENRTRLSKLIAEGRILVGPWYTLPEENIVDGECLVRNLLVGHAVAGEFGNVMKVGFTPTSYGQVSQMPQIYMGFGIDSILFHRGVPAHEIDLEYNWQGSDGTSILGIRPSLGGRFNFSTLVMNRLLNPQNGCDPPYSSASDRELHRSCGLKDEDGASPDDMYYSEAIPREWDKRTLQEALGALRELAGSGAMTPFLLCGEGHDLMEPNPIVPQVVEAANALLEKDRLFISSLPDYIARLRRHRDRLRTLTGEMRCTQKDESGARLYPGTLSSRMYLKQANRRTERMLIKWAEPFLALAWALGEPYPQALLQRAWKYLLANHAHDSISGTGTDQVHDDMMRRFEQCGQIATELTRKALGRLASRVTVAGAEPGDTLITIFNPLPFERDEVVQLDIDLPQTAPPHLRIRDAAGNDVAFHEHERDEKIYTVQQTHGFPHRFYAMRHRVSFLASSLPATGHKTYRVEACDKPPGISPHIAPEAAVRLTGDRQMENEHLRVTINADGTLRVLDKTTGRTYDRLNGFEDCGDIGDSYDHVKPPRDEVISSFGRTASIALAGNSPHAAAFEITLTLSLPEAISEDKTGRSEKHRNLVVRSTVTLRMNARRVDIVTRVGNGIKDHRLRVLMPTGVRTDTCQAHGQFDLIRRPIRGTSGDGWIEPPCPTQPQLDFVDLDDGQVGLAILNDGLPEYEVLDDADRTVAVTLLRGFTHKTRSTQTDDPTQTGTQCPGEHVFRYAIYPHAGDAIVGGVFAEAARHNTAVKAVQSWHGNPPKENPHPLPAEMSGLCITPGDLVVSGMKRSEDGKRLVVRFFNPTQQAVEARVRLHVELAEAHRMDLEENVLEPCRVDNRREVAFRVDPKRIITLGVVPA